MENRFGFKDLILFILLVVLILSIVLAMKQYDRQWQGVQSITENIRQLTAEQAQTRNQIHALQTLIEQGVTVSQAPADTPPGHGLDSFHRLREAQARDDWAQGDWLIDSFGSSISTITALVAKDAYGRTIQTYLLESLVERDPDTLQWLPHIAISWEIEDHSDHWHAYMEKTKARLAAEAESDPSVYTAQFERLMTEIEGDKPPAPGSTAYETARTAAKDAWIEAGVAADPARPPAMVVTFKLRKDVVFSDGKPLTAHDVVYTWELLKNPAIDAEAERNFYDNIATYEAPDDHTVRFTMTRPHYLAFGMVAGRPILPRHFYQHYTPTQINETPGLLLGSGPYRLKDPTSWTPGKPLVLLRNERYWGPPHAFARLGWKEITNDVARLTEFRNGEIDRLSATPEQFQDLSKDEQVLDRSAAYATDTLPTGYMFMAWNQRRQGKPTLFAKKQVRQAMTYLTERHRIAEQVMLGYATVASGPFPHGSPQADATMKARMFDVEKGQALLKQAGFEDRDGDGVLEDRQGRPFRYKLTYPSGSSVYDRVVLFLKDSYARAGIVMDLDPIEWSVFVEQLDSRTFDAIILRWGGGAIESDIRQMFHSSQIEGRANNFTSYANPELDALIDNARMTIDEKTRMAMWQACHQILWEDQPYTFMLTQKALRLIDRRIQNVQEIATGLNGRNEWYVPQPMQLRN